jgi:decaprenyl-phosphate phosphoribosyltransferase
MAKLIIYGRLTRPQQYVKNGFVWLPIFFSYRLGDWQAVKKVFWAFLVFCLCSSAMYIWNDFRDISEDRKHPLKRLRPLARGAVTTTEALGFMGFLLICSLSLALTFLNKEFLIILGAYLILNILYSNLFKRFAILDVTCIAIGFVLRVLGGGVAADIYVSHWLIIITFLLSLFLAFAKRRDDIILISNGYDNIRPSLQGYNLEFISVSMSIMAAVIIVSYALYTQSTETIQRHGTDKLYITTIWVVIGLLRYLQLAFIYNEAGSPSNILLNDRLLQIIIVFWLLSFITVRLFFGIN